MGLFEELIISDTIEIKTTPEKVFAYITGLVDDTSYRAWHPDHVSMRWLGGKPWQEGSVLYAEEYLHGKLHKLTFKAAKVIPNRLIEYVPANPLLRYYFPKNSFAFEPTENGTRFTASAHARVGWIVRTFFKKQLERGLEATRKHMKEEGENLKKILEEKR